MKQCDLLIKNCSILTPDFQIRKDCSVAVSDTRICQVGDARTVNAEWQGKEVIEAEGQNGGRVSDDLDPFPGPL